MSKTIHQYLDEFMYDCEFIRKLIPATLHGYRQIFLTFTTLQPDISFDALSPSYLIRFFQLLNTRKRIVGRGSVNVGVKKSTIRTYWSKLNSFFEWLEKMRDIPRNPFRDWSRWVSKKLRLQRTGPSLTVSLNGLKGCNT